MLHIIHLGQLGILKVTVSNETLQVSFQERACNLLVCLSCCFIAKVVSQQKMLLFHGIHCVLISNENCKFSIWLHSDRHAYTCTIIQLSFFNPASFGTHHPLMLGVKKLCNAEIYKVVGQVESMMAQWLRC